jgi:hypothetical protein
MNTCSKSCRCDREPTFTSRHSRVFTLSDREYLGRTFARNLSSRLLTLLPSNSGEGFPKVGINASRITKGLIEDRFH